MSTIIEINEKSNSLSVEPIQLVNFVVYSLEIIKISELSNQSKLAPVIKGKASVRNSLFECEASGLCNQ